MKITERANKGKKSQVKVGSSVEYTLFSRFWVLKNDTQ